MESDREWVRMFGVKLRETFEQLPVEFEKLQEIRLRAGQPVYLWYGNREYTMTADGGLAESGKLGQAGGRSVSPRIVGEKELRARGSAAPGDGGMYGKLFPLCL